jgi:hypothetical protein
MKSVVPVGRNRKVLLGAASAIVSLLAPPAWGVVTFELRDVEGSPVDADPHGTEVLPGGVFSFDVHVQASQGEQVLAVGFKLGFEQYLSLAGQTFTISSEPSRAGSHFETASYPGSVSGDRLEPDTMYDLGAYNSGFQTTTGASLFVARVSLQVDPTMPPGNYVVAAPNDEFFRWFGELFSEHEFDVAIPYSVNVVVPEPSTLGLIGAIGLLGFGLYRRLRG